MIDFPDIGDLCKTTPSKIVLLVVDGLGGLPHPDTGKSELETAHIPNLDELARGSACGLTIPVAIGVTPGSGPGHLALFGYDPIKYLIGRGVLEAIGIGVQLGKGDVAARGNLCTIDQNGTVRDRRAGRIPTAESAALVERLDRIEVPGVKLTAHAVRDHRFVLVFSGEHLESAVCDTDPGSEGMQPVGARALASGAEATASAVNAFTADAREALRDQDGANMVLLRGMSQLPDLPQMGSVYQLDPVGIAAYPMYRGLANLVGMKVVNGSETFDDELDALEESYRDHDFLFLHYKPADAAGEDGDFDAKVVALEELDASIPRILGLGPDVLVVAGDHSTPAIMGAHSWHPVPLLVRSELTRGEGVSEFSERAFASGSVGTVPATSVMMMALAHAGKLQKFGP